MLLTPYNSTYPPFWGKDFKKTANGWAIESQTLKVEIPKEFDFFNEWCGKDLANAREYFMRM